jgi:hypothetical protein
MVDFKNMLSKAPFSGGTGMAPKSFMDSGTLNTGPLKAMADQARSKIQNTIGQVRGQVQDGLAKAKANATSAMSSGKPAGMTGRDWGQSHKAANAVRQAARKAPAAIAAMKARKGVM